ncbi:MAG: hypothetical protein ACI8RZ_006431 [Myxococcota bacterium]|jgi:hypothetical protein
MRPILASLLSTLAIPDCAPEPPTPLPHRCGLTVQAYRQIGGHAEPIADGELLWVGDRIQFCFSGLPEDSWLSLTGMDSTDLVGLTHRWSAAEAPGCAPFSVELDAVPGPERIWITVHPDYPGTIPTRPDQATFTFTFPKAAP